MQTFTRFDSQYGLQALSEFAIKCDDFALTNPPANKRLWDGPVITLDGPAGARSSRPGTLSGAIAGNSRVAGKLEWMPAISSVHQHKHKKASA